MREGMRPQAVRPYGGLLEPAGHEKPENVARPRLPSLLDKAHGRRRELSGRGNQSGAQPDRALSHVHAPGGHPATKPVRELLSRHMHQRSPQERVQGRHLGSRTPLGKDTEQPGHAPPGHLGIDGVACECEEMVVVVLAAADERPVHRTPQQLGAE